MRIRNKTKARFDIVANNSCYRDFIESVNDTERYCFATTFIVIEDCWRQFGFAHTNNTLVYLCVLLKRRSQDEGLRIFRLSLSLESPRHRCHGFTEPLILLTARGENRQLTSHAFVIFPCFTRAFVVSATVSCVCVWIRQWNGKWKKPRIPISSVCWKNSDRKPLMVDSAAGAPLRRPEDMYESERHCSATAKRVEGGNPETFSMSFRTSNRKKKPLYTAEHSEISTGRKK